MRILYIITQADGGGAQKYVLTLAQHFKGEIAAGSEATELFNQAKSLQLKTYNLKHLRRKINIWHDLLAIWEIRQLILKLQPDIVHLNSTKAGILGSFAGIGTKSKIVFTAHGFIFNEPLPLWQKNFYLAAEKIASKYRSFIITVSQADRTSALENKLINENKIKTIYNGLAPVNFLTREEARLALKLTSNKFVVGCVANFYKTKGLDVLIDAMALLDEDLKNKILLAIIGNGPEFENCKLKIKNLQLQNSIWLLGKIYSASRYLTAFDCFVLPSRKEGFPYAILEALQAGLPIIATKVGGVPEAIGSAGLLVEKENPDAIKRAIVSVFSDLELRQKLMNSAHKQSQKFTETNMLEQTSQVYSSII